MQTIFCLFFLLAAVIVFFIAVDPYIYKITNNFLTCKLFSVFFFFVPPPHGNKPSEKSPRRFAVVNR